MLLEINHDSDRVHLPAVFSNKEWLRILKTINFMNTNKIAQVVAAGLLVYSPRAILARSVTY